MVGLFVSDTSLKLRPITTTKRARMQSQKPEKKRPRLWFVEPLLVESYDARLETTPSLKTAYSFTAAVQASLLFVLLRPAGKSMGFILCSAAFGAWLFSMSCTTTFRIHPMCQESHEGRILIDWVFGFV